MTNRRLHIIVFDIPYPANYGGAIDVFYRLKALSQSGIKITLHCFFKGELTNYNELESLCEKVYYYRRKTTWKQMLHLRPYAVVSRTSDELLQNLLADNDPIMFEGLVCCALMNHPLLAKRTKFLRECNIEHEYFYHLGKSADNFGNKLYYFADALRLKFFERIVKHAQAVLAIAHQDEAHFAVNYPALKVVYLPASHPNTHVNIPTGLGQYILYHGNLDVSENYNAARLIAENVASQLPDIPFVFAGRYHNHNLDSVLAAHPNIRIVPNPSEIEMQQLVRDAQIHLLITAQATGLKLKLLNVLYNGRHILVNDKMVEGTDLAPLCVQANSIKELPSLCRKYMTLPVSKEDIALRKKLLGESYDQLSIISVLHRVLDDFQGL